MSKFHINKHGVPAPCKATKGNCPLGGDGEHFNTQQEAQAYIDKTNDEKFGTIPHELGYVGVQADKAIDDVFTPGYYDLDFNAINEDVIGGEYFDASSHPKKRIVSFYREASRYDDLDTHSQALLALDDRRDAIEQVKEMNLSNPEDRYEALTQAQALNKSYEEGTRLAFDLVKQTREIAENEGLRGEEYDDLRDYVSNELLKSLEPRSSFGSPEKGRMKRRITLKDSRIPTFYRLNDWPEETLQGHIEETGADGFDHASWDTLDDEDKYDAFINVVDKEYYHEVYSLQDDEFVDYYADDMINHYELHGISDKNRSKDKLKEIGKRRFLKEFNDFVFYKQKPRWS